MIVPAMGRDVSAVPATGLAGALFTPVQQKVLGLLFGQPDRRFRSAEIFRLVDSGTGAVHRQLQRLSSVGLLLVTKDGNQKYYQARRESPVFADLHGLVTKTVGLMEPLRDALAPLADRIPVAFVYGSLAQGSDRASSDVDLFVVSDQVEYAELYEALLSAELTLARAVNPTVMRTDEWARKSSEGDSFAARVVERPKLFILGSENDLS